MMTDEGNDMEWPELPTHGHAEFTVWYEKVTRRFFDEVHTIKSVESTIDGDRAEVKVVVNWKASVWEPPAPKSIYAPHGRVPDLGGRARPGERQGADQQVLRRLLRPRCRTPTAASALDPRDVLIAYYRTANAGDWQEWLTLFQEDVVIDEQLAGHVEGLDILRGAIGGMEKGYSRFQNVPKQMVVQGYERRRRLAHLRRERGRRADRGRGDQLLPVPGREDRLHGELPRHAAVRSLRQPGSDD